MEINTSIQAPITHEVQGAPKTMTLPAILLRLEGAALLVAAVVLYREHGASWLLFAVLLLAPDLSMLGYLAGPRIGAAIYNVAHSYVGPLVLAAAMLSLGAGVTLALVWAAHIGFDRALGYGLKYPTRFQDTHLARI